MRTPSRETELRASPARFERATSALSAVLYRCTHTLHHRQLGAALIDRINAAMALAGNERDANSPLQEIRAGLRPYTVPKNAISSPPPNVMPNWGTDDL